MSKSISNSLKKTLLSILKILLFAAVCVLVSTAIVWPLWKFSTSLPAAYTIVILILLAAGILFLSVKKIIKTPFISVLSFFLNTIIICTGIFFSVRFVLHEKRLIALIILISTVILEIILNLILSRFKNEK